MLHCNILNIKKKNEHIIVKRVKNSFFVEILNKFLLLVILIFDEP